MTIWERNQYMNYIPRQIGIYCEQMSRKTKGKHHIGILYMWSTTKREDTVDANFAWTESRSRIKLTSFLFGKIIRRESELYSE